MVTVHPLKSFHFLNSVLLTTLLVRGYPINAHQIQYFVIYTCNYGLNDLLANYGHASKSFPAFLINTVCVENYQVFLLLALLCKRLFRVNQPL